MKDPFMEAAKHGKPGLNKTTNMCFPVWWGVWSLFRSCKLSISLMAYCQPLLQALLTPLERLGREEGMLEHATQDRDKKENVFYTGSGDFPMSTLMTSFL